MTYKARHREPRLNYAGAAALAVSVPFILAFAVVAGAWQALCPEKLKAHVSRFSWFSLIGLSVLITGLIVQKATISRLGPDWSYAVQAIFSIELSYLLNRRLTWPDRKVTSSLAKWNVQRIALTIPNYLGYAALIRYGHLNWLAANLGVTAVFVVSNYVMGDRWSFAAKPAVPVAQAMALAADWYPTVSIVIPCKNNPSTIGATARSLLGQDYALMRELIIVGDVNDPTWAGLADITDPRLIIVEHEQTPGKRDPNVKRHEGILKASGEVIALADSDIVMDPDWLTKAVGRLREQGSGLVAGGMRSIHDSFWGRFVDGNVLAAKTPRVPRPYQVTAKNFGRKGFKPPVSANAVFFREMYDRTELDYTWFYGYEDYEWFWRLAKEGHVITFDSALTASHHHRRSYRKLMQEYFRSSEGCAEFVRRHRDCPLARKRLIQGLALPALALAALSAAGYSAIAGYGAYLGGLAVTCTLALAAREVLRTRRLEAVAYPFIGLSLAGAFTVNLTRSLIMPRGPEDTVVQTWEDAELPKTREPWLRRHRYVLAMICVTAIGLLVRLWRLPVSPEWQLDEITYNAVAQNLISHGTLNVPLAHDQVWQPFLYHPPFYGVLLAQWDKLLGSVSIYSARLLGVLCTGIMFALLGRFLWKLYGRAAALFALTVMTFDGWLVYVERISYIENVLLVIMLAALLSYERAVRVRTWPSYLATGGFLGAAATFNHDGAYLILVVVIHWAFIRKDTIKHIAAIVVALAMLSIYAVAMIEIFTVNGTDWWLRQTLVQLRRLTGQQQSGGTLTSPAQFLHLLTNQYGIFLPSVLVTFASVVLLALLSWRSFRVRSLAPLGPDLIVPAWCIGGLAVFGPATLHFSQYFVMVLLPLYCFIWTRVWARFGSRLPRILLVGVTSALVVLGLGSSYLRLDQHANAFERFQQYAAHRIPRHDLVVAGTAGDPIAYVINQPWCSPGTDLSSYCLTHTNYVVTWQTYLQPPNPLHLSKLAVLLHKSTPIKVFRQFSGKITVWKVEKP